jgi:hypothetical protein
MMFELTFEVEKNGRWDRQQLPPTPDSVAAAMDKLASGVIGTLQLTNGSEELWVSGGREFFNVWARTGPDYFFDLIGDPQAKGTRELVVGGQISELPARHCISKDRALQAFWGLLSTGHIEVASDQWERQDRAVD